MGMPVSKVPTTADELEAIPEDGNRYEIIDGVLFVTPAPSTLPAASSSSTNSPMRYFAHTSLGASHLRHRHSRVRGYHLRAGLRIGRDCEANR